MPASKAQQAETAGRRTELIRLRLAGVSFDDPRILALGYSSPKHASKDMIRALRKRRDQQDAEASVYRQQQNMRLDALLEAVWPHATNPSREVTDDDGNTEQRFDRSAVDVALRLLERAAKLNGLDMPVQAEVSGPGGGPLQLGPVTVQALHNLIGMAGEPDPDEPDGEDYADEQYIDDDEDLDEDEDDADGHG